MEEAPAIDLVALAVGRSELPDALERLWDEGAAALPLDPELPRRVLNERLERLRPHRLVTSEGTTPLPEALSVATDVAVVLTTSGTTGTPKGVELSWDALEAAARLTNEAAGAQPHDRWLCCLPLHHIAGFMTLFRSRALGTSAVIHESFDVEAIAGETRARFVSLVPTMLKRAIDAGVDLSRFDSVLLGGDRIDPALLDAARDRGIRVVTTYGMTETCGGVVYDGVPLPGVRVSLNSESIIELDTPTAMRGYRLDAEGTARVLHGQRFTTGDRGRIDAAGRLHVLGRADDVIISAGNKVNPRRVEAVLREHPAVIEASVEGIADPDLGTRIVARVRVDGKTPPTAPELRAFAAERLSRHELPREIMIETDPAK